MERFAVNPTALNFHHLQYFWAVARDGNLTRTAQRLHIAQSALSTQIHQLEESLGVSLFAREGRRLVLTESGRIAFAYADDIFAAGGELLSTLQRGRETRQQLRVGAVATLARNFQRSFVRPLLRDADLRLRLQSGSLDELLDHLEAFKLDVVLAQRPPTRGSERVFVTKRLARQPVSVVASRRIAFRFPDDLAHHAMILPGNDSELRAEFDMLCARVGVRARIAAEVDDMSMIRLLVRDSDALALVPSIVVLDELRSGLVHELCVVPDLVESFYAITTERRFQHPLLHGLLARSEHELLALHDHSTTT